MCVKKKSFIKFPADHWVHQSKYTPDWHVCGRNLHGTKYSISNSPSLFHSLIVIEIVYSLLTIRQPWAMIRHYFDLIVKTGQLMSMSTVSYQHMPFYPTWFIVINCVFSNLGWSNNLQPWGTARAALHQFGASDRAPGRQAPWPGKQFVHVLLQITATSIVSGGSYTDCLSILLGLKTNAWSTYVVDSLKLSWCCRNSVFLQVPVGKDKLRFIFDASIDTMRVESCKLLPTASSAEFT